MALATKLKEQGAVRDLPKSVEAEQIVLGCVLFEPQTVASVVEKLRAEDFCRSGHRTILRAISRLYGRGAPCDSVSVSSDLDEHGEMEKAGGRLYLASLMEKVVTTTVLDYYVGIVRKKAALRALIEAGSRISELGYGETEEVETQLARAEEIFGDLLRNGDSGPGGSTWQALESEVGPIEWAWSGWLPRGFLVLLAGDPGSGKSALALRVAASFLDGRDWPDGSPFEGETGSVLWCEAESAQAIHLSRARAWDLPLEKIRTPFPSPLTDVRLDDLATMRRIRTTASDPDVRLVIVDSFSGAHRKDEKTLDAGWIAASLATLARDTRKPVLACHHLRKRAKEELAEVSLERVRGSSSICQYSRVVWGLDQPNLEQLDCRRLVQVKNNLAGFPSPLGFAIDENGVTFGEAPVRPHVDSQVDRAADLLLALLRVRPRPASELQREADGAALSWRTMERAKAKLGIVAIRKGEAWLWSLPAPEEAPF